MTPRMPAQLTTTRTRVVGLAVGSPSPSTCTTLRDTSAVANTQNGRIAITVKHTAAVVAVSLKKKDATRLIETLVASDRSRYLPPFHIALAYAGLGDKDAALRWLERAYTERASFMDGLNVTPGFDVLRSDPRFAALLERMRF